MRISDWSSDVCSSDLVHRGTVLPSHCDGDVLLPEPLAAFVLPAQHAGDDVTRAVERNRPRDAFEIVVPGAGQQMPDQWMVHVQQQHLAARSEEHTYELQSLMRISYAVFCLKKKKQ